MLWLAFKVSENYAIDMSGPRQIRRFSDGISFFELTFNLDLYHGDHNPQLNVMLMVMNFCLFEFNWYNVNHVEHEPFKPCKSCGGSGEES